MTQPYTKMAATKVTLLARTNHNGISKVAVVATSNHIRPIPLQRKQVVVQDVEEEEEEEEIAHPIRKRPTPPTPPARQPSASTYSTTHSMPRPPPLSILQKPTMFAVTTASHKPIRPSMEEEEEEEEIAVPRKKPKITPVISPTHNIVNSTPKSATLSNGTLHKTPNGSAKSTATTTPKSASHKVHSDKAETPKTPNGDNKTTPKSASRKTSNEITTPKSTPRQSTSSKKTSDKHLPSDILTHTVHGSTVANWIDADIRFSTLVGVSNSNSHVKRLMQLYTKLAHDALPKLLENDCAYVFRQSNELNGRNLLALMHHTALMVAFLCGAEKMTVPDLEEKVVKGSARVFMPHELLYEAPKMLAPLLVMAGLIEVESNTFAWRSREPSEKLVNWAVFLAIVNGYLGRDISHHPTKFIPDYVFEQIRHKLSQDWNEVKDGSLVTRISKNGGRAAPNKDSSTTNHVKTQETFAEIPVTYESESEDAMPCTTRQLPRKTVVSKPRTVQRHVEEEEETPTPNPAISISRTKPQQQQQKSILTSKSTSRNVVVEEEEEEIAEPTYRTPASRKKRSRDE